MGRSTVRHEDFAARFTMACDNNQNVPEKHYGRQSWIAGQFKDRFDVDVTSETVRKWGLGLARPHPHSKMVQLAEILRVDPAWLDHGTTDGLDKKKNRIRHEVADGAVNLVAGLVQMGGSHPAFPVEGDRFAAENCVDLYAIIRGIQHAFHIVTAEPTAKGFEFAVPQGARNVIVLGVVPEGGLRFSIVQIDMASAEAVGDIRGGMLHFSLEDVEHRPVNSFAEKF